MYCIKLITLPSVQGDNDGWLLRTAVGVGTGATAKIHLKVDRANRIATATDRTSCQVHTGGTIREVLRGPQLSKIVDGNSGGARESTNKTYATQLGTMKAATLRIR